jgi:hypothetical protein
MKRIKTVCSNFCTLVNHQGKLVIAGNIESNNFKIWCISWFKFWMCLELFVIKKQHSDHHPSTSKLNSLNLQNYRKPMNYRICQCFTGNTECIIMHVAYLYWQFDTIQLSYCVCVDAYHLNILRYVLGCTITLLSTILTISVYVRLEVNLSSKHILLMNTNDKLLTIASPWIIFLCHYRVIRFSSNMSCSSDRMVYSK